jgi:hypothetical protein
MIKKYWREILDIYKAYQFKKLIRDEQRYILSLPDNEALIEITRWRWKLSRQEMDEQEEKAWDNWLNTLEKIIR